MQTRGVALTRTGGTPLQQIDQRAVLGGSIVGRNARRVVFSQGFVNGMSASDLQRLGIERDGSQRHALQATVIVLTPRCPASDSGPSGRTGCASTPLACAMVARKHRAPRIAPKVSKPVSRNRCSSPSLPRAPGRASCAGCGAATALRVNRSSARRRQQSVRSGARGRRAADRAARPPYSRRVDVRTSAGSRAIALSSRSDSACSCASVSTVSTISAETAAPAPARCARTARRAG